MIRAAIGFRFSPLKSIKGPQSLKNKVLLPTKTPPSFLTLVTTNSYYYYHWFAPVKSPFQFMKLGIKVWVPLAGTL